MFAAEVSEDVDNSYVVTVAILINDTQIHVLFDSGCTHSFISRIVVESRTSYINTTLTNECFCDNGGF